MRRAVRVWAVVVVLVLLHFTLRVGLALDREVPDLLVVALLLAAREARMGTAAALGLVAGLLEDAFSVLSFGSNTLSMALVGAIGSRTRDFFVGDSVLFLASYLAVGKWTRDLIHWVTLGGGLRESFVHELLIESPVDAAYAAVAGTVVVVLTGAWWESNR